MKTIGLTLTLFGIFFCTALTAQEKTIKQNEEGVYMEAEVMPEFPGGEMELRQFIARAVNYPEQAKKEGITGKVFVSFVVDETGKVINTKVVRGVHPLLDGEAVRVVEAMPDWTPGKVKDKAVKVAYTIPIMFALK